MSITRHPDDSTLMSYAAGSLPAALAIVVAAHVSICPRCRDEVATMELLGGTLLGGLPGADLQGPQPEMPVVGHHGPARPASMGSARASAEVPAPLARLVGGDLDALRWRWVAPGSRLRRVPFVGAGRLHLFKCAPSIMLPEHGHEGSELTMVLRGALSDSTGHYGPGDVCDIDESVEHTPMAGADGCICVVAQDRPVRFRSLIVRLARPWHGM
jgi:putative transcriptional regulator